LKSSYSTKASSNKVFDL